MKSFIVKATVGALGALGAAISAGAISAEGYIANTGRIETSFMNGLTAQHISFVTDDNGATTASMPDSVKQIIDCLEENAPCAPDLSEALVSADEISVKVNNLSDYAEGTIFNVYVNGTLLKTVTLEELGETGCISADRSSSECFRAETNYRIAVEPQLGLMTSRSQIAVSTGEDTYFSIPAGSLLYNHTSDGFCGAYFTSYDNSGQGYVTDTEGSELAGQSADTEAQYVKITEGEYAGLYVKQENTERVSDKEAEELETQAAKDKAEAEEKAKAEAERQQKLKAEQQKKQAEALAAQKEAAQKAAEQAKQQAAADNAASGDTSAQTTASDPTREQRIQTVINYALANVGGAYVSCGARFRACDCCGLTMLAYQQIGVYLQHSCYGQAMAGKIVPVSQMQPGDIIICRGYGHAMLYIGNNEVVHAMNRRDGIRRQNAQTAMYYNPVTCVVRII
ncbi:MAG: C40 family peptidase [Ruminococcus sp.]|nr:C40 family peptidase [Ruminococcus sp.]